MIGIDTNILVYSHRRDSRFHAPAATCIRELAEGRAPWVIPWPCIHEFFAIVTHPRIYDPPSATGQAIDQVEAWIGSPTLSLLGETPDHWPTLAKLLRDGRIVGPLVHDARVAALCIAHGVREFWSVDRDFGRFPPLRVRNPLQ
ncbi:MAG: type II toxin-antitoxin system VapC family toxin [Egibacteraceae bacterium]